MDILEVVWADQDVIPRHQVHHEEQGRARHIAKRDALIVRGDVRTFTKISQNLNVRGQMLERITRIPFSRGEE